MLVVQVDKELKTQRRKCKIHAILVEYIHSITTDTFDTQTDIL